MIMRLVDKWVFVEGLGYTSHSRVYHSIIEFTDISGQLGELIAADTLPNSLVSEIDITDSVATDIENDPSLYVLWSSQQ